MFYKYFNCVVFVFGENLMENQEKGKKRIGEKKHKKNLIN